MIKITFLLNQICDISYIIKVKWLLFVIDLILRDLFLEIIICDVNV